MGCALNQWAAPKDERAFGFLVLVFYGFLKNHGFSFDQISWVLGFFWNLRRSVR